MAHDDDVTVPMHDGVMLLADVHRPAEPGRYPVTSCRLSLSGRFKTLVRRRASLKLVPAISSFPRGYVHVIANCRGTSGSGGTFGFFDGQERRDMYDLVEWAAQQPWSNGNVGMIGSVISPGPRWKLPLNDPRISKPPCPSPEPLTSTSRRPIMD
jgi:uncharacterized protein